MVPPASTTTTSPRSAPGLATGAARFLLGGAWVALFAAFVDVAVSAWGFTKRPFTWRLPLETALAHLVLGLALALLAAGLWALLARLVARLRPPGPFAHGLALGLAAYVFVFGSFLRFSAEITRTRDPGVLLRPGALLVLVGLLLVAGLLALGVHALARRFGPAGERVLPATLAACALYLAASLGAVALRPQDEPLSAGAPPVAALPSGVKNVLWIVMDTTRRDRMTVYDPTLQTTPNLARLAAEGTVFEAASSSSTFTLSSHASMLTGLSPSGHNATLRTQWLAPRVALLPVEFGRAGLATAGFVANRVLRLETGLDAGFDHYDDVVDPEVCYTTVWRLVHDVQAALAQRFKAFRGNGRPHWIENHQRSAAEENERIERWLDANGERPFFLFANYYDVHWPYLPEEPWRSKFVVPYDGPMTGYLERDDDYEPGYVATAEDNRYLLSLYDAELAYLDEQVANLLDSLERRGVLDETLVVITADHGEHFGELGKHGHDELYEPGLAVPMILRLPGVVPAGLRVSDPVQVADLFPTVLELAGLELPEGLGSRSLVPYLEREAPQPGPVIAEDFDNYQYVLKVARLGPMKLIKGFEGRAGNEQLFDLLQDPGELENLLAEDAPPLSEEMQSVLDALRAIIQGLQDPTSGGGAGELTPEALEVLRALGYI